MATQNCPRCKGSRIRQGYRHTSFFQKIMFRYNLLCNDCNWEFVGFAVPGTVSAKVKRKEKKTSATPEIKLSPESENGNKLINQLLEQRTSISDDSSIDLVEQPVEENIITSIDLVEQTVEENITNENDLKKNKPKKRVRIKLS